MKAKYEKMIDEYVKKHYGDLERGVLAPEVKYKVLFKIYRNKYRKKKILAETFSRMLTKEEKGNQVAEELPCHGCEHYVPMHSDEGLTIIPASCKIGREMTPWCPFYSVKVDEKKAQKKMNTCNRCKYSTFKTVTDGREAATGKLWCTRNNFETSGVTSCDWFEDDAKAQGSYLDWLHDDITWCCRECSDMNCERNTMNRKMTSGLCSMADMYDPFKCPVDAELPKQP